MKFDRMDGICECSEAEAEEEGGEIIKREFWFK